MSSIADNEALITFKKFDWFEPYISPIIERDRVNLDRQLSAKLASRGILSEALIDFIMTESTPKMLRELSATIAMAETSQPEPVPALNVKRRVNLASKIFSFTVGESELLQPRVLAIA